MTIASGPERPHLDFAVQRSDSEFKRLFFALGAGDTLRVGPPRGAFILERGRIVMSGSAAELARSDEVRRAYLGI